MIECNLQSMQVIHHYCFLHEFRSNTIEFHMKGFDFVCVFDSEYKAGSMEKGFTTLSKLLSKQSEI